MSKEQADEMLELLRRQEERERTAPQETNQRVLLVLLIVACLVIFGFVFAASQA